MKNRKRNKMLALCVCFALLLCTTNVKNVALFAKEKSYGLENPRNERSTHETNYIWDCIYFGNYYKDGTSRDRIKWRVLSVKGDDAFLITDKVIDCQVYDNDDKNVKWEECSLRKWLNDTFYKEAFNKDERKAIKSTKIVDADEKTTDKIYLLSEAEAINTGYNFLGVGSYETRSREARATQYARVKGVEIDLRDTYSRETCCWWLRTSEKYDNCIKYVDRKGSISNKKTNESGMGVRPVLHINLSSSSWVKAGVENSNYGLNNPYFNSNDLSVWDCIYFGNYYQSNSKKKEPIKWRVLSVNGDDAFLVSDKVLDCQQYNEIVYLDGRKETEDVEYTKLSLWLNTYFYEEAFNLDEKASINVTKLTDYNREIKIFVLSKDDVNNGLFGFPSLVTSPNMMITKNRQAQATKYAISKGAISNDGHNRYDVDDASCRWWVRSRDSGSVIDYFGNICNMSKVSKNVGVRPALHLNLLNKKWKKAGMVNSDGESTQDILTRPLNKFHIKSSYYGLRNPGISKEGFNTWDCVYFGNYYQDDSKKKKPIKWRVLEISENDAFLISEDVLDYKKYNDKDDKDNKNKTWEQCSLRKWLNEDFYKEAFNINEQKAIKTTNVKDDDEYTYSEIKMKSNTFDKVYILSPEEACNPSYGFISDLLIKTKTRESKATEYVKKLGCNTCVDEKQIDNCSWWLRTQNVINMYGFGRERYREKSGVRPVIHIDIKQPVWEKADRVCDDYGIQNPSLSKKGVASWDYIFFGSYYQSNNEKKEPIKWRVLSVYGDDAFLISDEVLDCKQYHKKEDFVTWEESDLRKWLNNTFYEKAFNIHEKISIKRTYVVNEDNKYFGSDGGKNTSDNIYIPSISEMCNTSFGFAKYDDAETTLRSAKVTNYAKKQGVKTFNGTKKTGICNWWLRSPGYSNMYASYVHVKGWIGCDEIVNEKNYGVRPVLHITPSSYLWHKIGRISEKGEIVKRTKKETTPKINKVFEVKLKRNGKKGLDIKWSKVNNAEKYEVQYSKKKNFVITKNRTTISEKTSKTEITINNLKKNTTYYVRVRGYKKVGNVINYGLWSNVKKIKIK